MNVQALGYLFAGVGFCCISALIISRNAREISSSTLQKLFIKSTGNPLLAGFVGILSGFLTQVSSIVSYITYSVTVLEKKNLEKMLVVINWNATGMCLLLFVFLINLDIYIPYLIGIAGVLIVMIHHLGRYKHIMFFVLGLLFLYFGITLIKTYSGALMQHELAGPLIIGMRKSYYLSFLVGAFFSGVTLAYVALGVIVITFATSGVLDLNQSAMILYGSHLGLGLVIWLQAIPLKGYLKRAIGAITAYHLGVAILCVPLIYLETLAGIPLLGSLSETFSDNVGTQVAFLILLSNIFTALLFSLFNNFQVSLILKPLSDADEINYSSPQYLNPLSLDDVPAAISLLTKENQALVDRYSNYFEYMLEMARGNKRTKDCKNLHLQFESLFSQLKDYFIHLIQKPLSTVTSRKLIMNLELCNVLECLEENIYEKTSYIEDLISDEGQEEFQQFVQPLIESEYAIILDFIKAINEPDLETTSLVLTSTEEREKLIYDIRRKYFKQEDQLEIKVPPSHFSYLTASFSRSLWLIGKGIQMIEKIKT